MRWHNWAIFIFGLWLAVSPYILGFSRVNLVAWNNVVLGVFIMLFSLWEMAPPEE